MTNSIKKGNQGQRDVANMFKRWFPQAQSSSHAQRNPDSKLPDIIGGVEKYFYVEVKRYKKIRPKQLRDWFSKAVDDEEAFNHTVETEVLIVYRKDRDKWRIFSRCDEDWDIFSKKLDKSFGVVDDSR